MAAQPEAREDIFQSLEMIWTKLYTGYPPDADVKLPLNRVYGRVNLRFGGGLESTMSLPHLKRVVWAILGMMIEHRPREILGGTVVVDGEVEVVFSLKFRWFT